LLILILHNKPYEYSSGDRKPPSQPATSQARRGETLAGKVAFGKRLGREEEIYIIILKHRKAAMFIFHPPPSTK
jgi:hypothetical protein